VDGAIFSGFAMVLILILPMRYIFNWYEYITDKHLDAMAKLILVTSLVLSYFYICEVFTAWYSGDHFERASGLRQGDQAVRVGVLGYVLLQQHLAPRLLLEEDPPQHDLALLHLHPRPHRMWLERFNIIVPGLGFDFYPYTWGTYYPTITDSTIIVGSFAWFFLLSSASSGSCPRCPSSR